MYVDGMNLRRIGRHLGVSPQSVANWVNAHAAQLPPAPLPDRVETVEMDELFTFIEEKKTVLHRDFRRPGDTLLLGLVSLLGSKRFRGGADLGDNAAWSLVL